MDSGHNCEETKKYSAEYDVYYCENCNKWLESKCSDPKCEFCTTRPESPNIQNLLTSQ
jgi:hypothetical protein